MEHPHSRDRFVKKLRLAHEVLDFELYEWVVMKNHVHLLLRQNTAELTVPKILSRIKTQYAKEELPRLRERGVEETRFWLPGGGYDRNIVSIQEYDEKANYIVNNPVQSGFVKRAEDWKWSSAGWTNRFWDDS